MKATEDVDARDPIYTATEQGICRMASPTLGRLNIREKLPLLFYRRLS